MICLLGLLLAGLTWTVLPLSAQTALATITGTVTDQQGAGVPNVKVTVTNNATMLTYSGTSSSDGTYVIPQLPIGAYSLVATAPGFKTFQQRSITVEVSQRLRLDIRLEVGAVSESVNVTAELPRVQTEDSTLGAVVERKRIEELPLNGRHVFNLVKIVAGVQPRFNNTDGFAEISNQAFSQIRINGGPAYGNQFFLDGSVNSAPVHNEIAVVPMVDAVQEFRVETNALKAEFGQTSGGVINVVTKSGTNEFHGSLYEFVRNDALDARNAFSTQPDPRTGRIKQLLRYHQFGGTVGGPVWLPRMYNGGNQTFFFVGYEQWRWVSSGAPRLGSVAIPEWREGNFSNLRDGRGQLIPLFDPATTAPNPAGSGFVRAPLPGNLVPRSRMDPLSLRVLAFMPEPNATPTDPFTFANNFTALIPSRSNQGVTSLRVDHRLSESDSLFFRYSGTRNTRQDRGWGLGPADPAARNDQRDNHNAILNYTRVISPRLLNDLRFAASRQWLPFLHPSFDQNWPQRLGYPAIIPQDQFPPVTISGLLGIGSSGFSGGLRAQQYVQIVDSVNYTRGRHNFKTGIDLRWSRLSFINRVNPSGLFNFTAALTGNPLVPANTGLGLASFLLGEVAGGQQGFRPFFQYRSLPLGVYFQDDWKVTPRLTLNIGVRYDVSFGPSELHDRHSSFDPFVVNPETQMPGVMTYAGVGRPRTFVDLDRNNFGPRIGLAWDPRGDGKTAIRAGYGLIYTISEIGHTQGDNSSALGFSVDTPFQAPTATPQKAFQFSVGPSFLLQPLGAAGGPSAFRGFSVRYQDRNGLTPYMQQWNFTIQRALWAGWVASVVYAGSKGTKLFGGNYDLNQLDPRFFALGLALQDNVPNPFRGQIASGPLSGATVARSQLLRPYPDYQTVQTFAANNASSTFHSFQLFVEKRFSSGISALFSYTNSKLITDALSVGGGGSAAGLADFRLGLYNRRIEKSIDSDDVSQRLVASGVVEIPIGRGRKFGSNMSALLDAFAGGWQMNGIATLQTGQPLSVRGTNNFTGIPYPDVIADPTLPKSERSPNRWFNTEVFRNPPNFTIGNSPRTLPRTRAPGLVDVAFSLFKTFRIQERFRLEARWEIFNALNSVNLNAPNTAFSPNAQGVNTNANFGRIFSALDARRMQLGLRLTF
ncbi:MAG: TonB-dependent receptor [Bryobacteraceae bacterium]|nr:TonB-dependent receptor [Bryobacteraceae bacterium]MDW8379534.1 TonB-dependent receptor [Bryobacterales bacterium]